METIFDIAYQAVLDGSPFSINFQKKSLKIGKKFLIKNGEYKGELQDGSFMKNFPEDFSLDGLEMFYANFYYSVPSEQSEKRRKKYFIALPLNKLEDDDMLYGMRRDAARFLLEWYVLSAIIRNQIVWEDFASGKWFWKSQKYPSLVLLKKWFVDDIKQ